MKSEIVKQAAIKSEYPQKVNVIRTVMVYSESDMKKLVVDLTPSMQKIEKIIKRYERRHY
jgi:hypothetical protein